MHKCALSGVSSLTLSLPLDKYSLALKRQENTLFSSPVSDNILNSHWPLGLFLLWPGKAGSSRKWSCLEGSRHWTMRRSTPRVRINANRLPNLGRKVFNEFYEEGYLVMRRAPLPMSSDQLLFSSFLPFAHVPTISCSLVMLHPSCCQCPRTLLESSLCEAAEVVKAPPTWKVPPAPRESFAHGRIHPMPRITIS